MSLGVSHAITYCTNASRGLSAITNKVPCKNEGRTKLSSLTRSLLVGCAVGLVKKVKEADLYSAFTEVPYTQGAQVRITQCYLQITLYLPLPRKHSPDGASQIEVADI